MEPVCALLGDDEVLGVLPFFVGRWSVNNHPTKIFDVYIRTIDSPEAYDLYDKYHVNIRAYPKKDEGRQAKSKIFIPRCVGVGPNEFQYASEIKKWVGAKTAAATLQQIEQRRGHLPKNLQQYIMRRTSPWQRWQGTLIIFLGAPYDIFAGSIPGSISKPLAFSFTPAFKKILRLL